MDDPEAFYLSKYNQYSTSLDDTRNFHTICNGKPIIVTIYLRPEKDPTGLLGWLCREVVWYQAKLPQGEDTVSCNKGTGVVLSQGRVNPVLVGQYEHLLGTLVYVGQRYLSDIYLVSFL
jgi:hypothetical protein